jgi:hypothetical protein
MAYIYSMINLLSKPSKMPCYGFNLPAMKFCPAAIQALKEYAENAVCSHCYAMGGTYLFTNVKKSLENKANFLLKSLREDKGQTFVVEMVKQITEAYSGGKKKLNGRVFNKTLFRVHDSGDLFSPAYIDCWIAICKQLPNINFWFPTREYIRHSQLPKLRELASLENTIVRPSALTINAPVPVIEGLDNGTSVHKTLQDALDAGYKPCPATIKKNRIGLAAWRKLSKAEQQKFSSCAGMNCKACFIKGCQDKYTYLAH